MKDWIYNNITYKCQRFSKTKKKRRKYNNDVRR